MAVNKTAPKPMRSSKQWAVVDIKTGAMHDVYSSRKIATDWKSGEGSRIARVEIREVIGGHRGQK